LDPDAFDAEAYVVRSRGWYKRALGVAVKLMAAMAVALALQGALLVHLGFRDKETLFFAATPDLRLIELQALTEPTLTPQALLNWTADVVCGTLSLDFLHWKRKLMDMRGNFDPDGFASLVGSLEEGGHLEKIKRERLSLSAGLSEAPVIVSQGTVGGRMTWKVEMPLVISYQSSAGVVATQRVLAEVWVERVPASQNPRGVQVRQLVLGKLG
jgi:intracellular multiplication protein IcmL